MTTYERILSNIATATRATARPFAAVDCDGTVRRFTSAATRREYLRTVPSARPLY